MGTSVIEELTFTDEKKVARVRTGTRADGIPRVHTASLVAALLSLYYIATCIINELDSAERRGTAPTVVSRGALGYRGRQPALDTAFSRPVM